VLVSIFSFLAQAIFWLVVCYFFLYVGLELRALLISRKTERRKLAQLTATQALPVQPPAGYPPVTVLLPVCNESAVIERLIHAVCQMQYPAGQLEILVLDDSTDQTSALAQQAASRYQAAGIDIRVLRRPDRNGFKAGNLIHGIEQSRGEFFAIFDADFLPPADFLLRTMPCFSDPELGFLQTGIGYENRDHSFLTRFQAMEMGHQQYVTVGLSEDGDMASLSGSSCVWRKRCIEAVGGWSDATVTEDVDLGYRAQFSHWKYAYLRDVMSMSILPETISAFRMQRERWGRGLIHSAFKHAGAMFHQRMPLMRRLHAISTMFSSLLLASIHVLVLLSLPLNYLLNFEAASVQWGALLFFILAGVWGVDNAIGASKGAWINDKRSLGRMVWDSYLYIALFLPMAWYYFFGGCRALFGVYGEFHRTPKAGDEHRTKMPRANTAMLLGEIFTFFYSLAAVLVALDEDNFCLVPLNVTVCVGFAMVLYWSWKERLSRDHG